MRDADTPQHLPSRDAFPLGRPNVGGRGRPVVGTQPTHNPHTTHTQPTQPSPTRGLANDPDFSGNVWQTVERLQGRVTGLEADVAALTADKAAAVDEKRRLWSALRELASAAGPAALTGLTDATGGLVARVRSQGVSLDELAEAGLEASEEQAAGSTGGPSLAALASRVTTLETEKAELEEALLTASAAVGTDSAAVERAAAVATAAQALAHENARLAARLRALHERAPAVAAAGEMLESLRDEAAGLRADNKRLAEALDAASAHSKTAAGLAALRLDVKRVTDANAKLAADLRAAKRALAAAVSTAGTPTGGGNDDVPAFDLAIASSAPGAATTALLAAELRNVRAEVARLRAGSSDDTEVDTPTSAAAASTPRSPSLRFLLPRPKLPRAEKNKLQDRFAHLMDDNARLLEENARLAQRAGVAADRAIERGRRDARDGRLTDALSGLVRELTDENAALTHHVRALAADRAVEAAFASDDGARRGMLSAADVDALAERRGHLAARAAGVLATASVVGGRKASEGGMVDVVAVCAAGGGVA